MTGLGLCRTGSEMGRGDLGCWAVGIWTGPRWASGPGLWRQAEGGRCRGRTRAAGSARELGTFQPWASCGSRRKVELGVPRRRAVGLGEKSSWESSG
ncbi:hypothetical protein CRG98_022502 [Punica granatum]|uniref:Uncharacterized protein n=1 Tax=Punica granatum TaxID=22663 RepID=A0A2I0JLF8_PUNGR|nr:hypothetical protein CRG98_022502 [Punica granatum]